MHRCFMSCVKQVKYDSANQRILTKYENIVVLVGPKESMNLLYQEVEKFIAEFRGSFQTRYSVKALDTQ